MNLRLLNPLRLAHTMIGALPYPSRYRATSWELCVQPGQKSHWEPNPLIESVILASLGRGDGLRFRRAHVITGHRRHRGPLARHAHDKPRCELRSDHATASRDRGLNQIHS